MKLFLVMIYIFLTTLAFTGCEDNPKDAIRYIDSNNNGFEIERTSLNPPLVRRETGEWRLVGFVKGEGTTTELSGYSFVDKNPFEGKSLYRLKQIDYDQI